MKELSVIIPALNEEHYIANTIESVLNQDADLEIIVAVSPKTTDRTAEIALEYGTRIIKGGLLPEARNNGVKNADSNLFLFLDADVILPENGLRKFLNEFHKRKLDLAGTLQKPLSSISKTKDIQHALFYGIANIGITFFQHSKKPYMQMCMFSKREIHENIGGFRLLEFGEDSEYACRAVKAGANFGVLNGFVYTSPRRLENEGLKGMIKYAKFNFGRILGNEYPVDGKYRFYDENERCKKDKR